MFKIRDVFQIRNIEKRIGRRLTPKELLQIDDGERLILESKDRRSVVVETVMTYRLSDLMPGYVGPGFIDQTQKSSFVSEFQKGKQEWNKSSRKVKDSAASKANSQSYKLGSALLREHGFNDVEDENGDVKPERFSENQVQYEHYFSQVDHAIVMTESQNAWDDPTEEEVIRRHADGQSDRDIAKFFISEHNKLFKKIAVDAVGRRRRRFLIKNKINPIEFNK